MLTKQWVNKNYQVSFKVNGEQLSPSLSRLPKQVSTACAAPNHLPRSQPISVKQKVDYHRKSSASSDISSISPPAVQFAIGTPPTGKQSFSETPPLSAPTTWQVSPGSQAQSSPIRRSGQGSPVIPAGLTKLPALGSPTLAMAPTAFILNNGISGSENNNKLSMLGPRAFTLPELGATGGLQSLLDTNGCATGAGTGAINHDNSLHTFHAPELSEETLMDREHNETLSKLNFVLALTDCIQEVADSRCAPLSAIMPAGNAEQAHIPPHAPEHCKRSERLVLLVRALQLLSSGLNLASVQLRVGNLKPSSNVKNGVYIHIKRCSIYILIII